MTEVKLFGGFQGIRPPVVGAIDAEYVVLGSPCLAPWSDTILAVEKAVNREKRSYGLRYGHSWSVGLAWEWVPRNETEAQRVVGTICDGYGNVGKITLVWPSKEVMEGTL